MAVLLSKVSIRSFCMTAHLYPELYSGLGPGNIIIFGRSFINSIASVLWSSIKMSTAGGFIGLEEQKQQLIELVSLEEETKPR